MEGRGGVRSTWKGGEEESWKARGKEGKGRRRGERVEVEETDMKYRLEGIGSRKKESGGGGGAKEAEV